MRIVAKLILLIGVLATAASAEPPKWERTEGKPGADCFRFWYEAAAHIEPSASLSATSSDHKLAWAITADDLGLNISACSSSRINTALIIGRSKGNLTKEVSAHLIEVTLALLAELAPIGSVSGATTYLQEVRQLQTILKPSLYKLVHDARTRYPALLHGEPQIRVLVP